MTTTSETIIRPGTDPDAGLVRLRARLLDQAYLFDDPAAYAAGVEDTLRALEPAVDRPPKHV